MRVRTSSERLLSCVEVASEELPLRALAYAEDSYAQSVLIALDRMEKSGTADQVGTHSAVQDVQREYGVPVISIASLKDLLAYLDASQDPALGGSREAVELGSMRLFSLKSYHILRGNLQKFPRKLEV